jgi:hypothetical protein
MISQRILAGSGYFGDTHAAVRTSTSTMSLLLTSKTDAVVEKPKKTCLYKIDKHSIKEW